MSRKPEARLQMFISIALTGSNCLMFTTGLSESHCAGTEFAGLTLPACNEVVLVMLHPGHGHVSCSLCQRRGGRGKSKDPIVLKAVSVAGDCSNME